MLMIYYSILLIRQYLRLLTNINISIKHYKIKLKNYIHIIEISKQKVL